MKIETERLIIRSIQRGDEKIFADMAKDGSLAHDIGFDEKCEEWLGDWIEDALIFSKEDNLRKNSIAEVICLKENGAIVGSVGNTYYEDTDEIGIVYFIGADYRGHGYAYEAAKEYIDYMFRHYDIEKLGSRVREANVPSWKIHDKLGFQLIESKMYQDYNDEAPELYRFYLFRKE